MHASLLVSDNFSINAPLMIFYEIFYIHLKVHKNLPFNFIIQKTGNMYKYRHELVRKQTVRKDERERGERDKLRLINKEHNRIFICFFLNIVFTFFFILKILDQILFFYYTLEIY